MPVTTGPRFGLHRWSDDGDPWSREDWDADNAAVEDLGALDIQVANLAARPAAGIRGRYCFVDDTDRLYRDDGAAWVEYAKAELVPVVAVKPISESVTNSTVLQDDDHLLFDVAANTTYVLRGRLLIDSEAANNIKLGWSMPVAAKVTGGFGDAAGNQLFEAVSDATINQGTAFPTRTYLTLAFVFVIGANAGTVKLRWAQDTAGPNPTTIVRTSHIQVQKAG